MAPPFRDNSRGKGTIMDWARILAYVTGTVDQELLARNEYLAAENRILKQCRYRLVDVAVRISRDQRAARRWQRRDRIIAATAWT
jgi:hypothetical protein